MPSYVSAVQCPICQSLMLWHGPSDLAGYRIATCPICQKFYRIRPPTIDAEEVPIPKG